MLLNFIRNKSICVVAFIFIFSNIINAQIQPDQIGFPPNNDIQWVLAIDTVNGKGKWIHPDSISSQNSGETADFAFYKFNSELPVTTPGDSAERSGYTLLTGKLASKTLNFNNYFWHNQYSIQNTESTGYMGHQRIFYDSLTFPVLNEAYGPFGEWMEMSSWSSAINSPFEVGGNLIYIRGFNYDIGSLNYNPLRPGYSNRVEHGYYPGSGNTLLVEGYDEIRDTLGRISRPYNWFAAYDGSSAGFSTTSDNTYVYKSPDQSVTNGGIWEHMNYTTGLHTMYNDYKLKISNDYTGSIISKYWSPGNYFRNVLYHEPNNRLYVGDSSGIKIKNTLLFSVHTEDQKIKSSNYSLRFDTVFVDFLGTPTGTYRNFAVSSPGISEKINFGYDGNYLRIGKYNSTEHAFQIHKDAPNYTIQVTSTGRLGINTGGAGAYSILDIGQKADNLSGGIILHDTDLAAYMGNYINTANEYVFNHTGSELWKLKPNGLINASTYDSTPLIGDPIRLVGHESDGDFVSTSIGDGLQILDGILSVDGSSSSDQDWFEVGTLTSPNSILDTIYHNGIVTIGDDTLYSGALNVLGRLDVRFPVAQNKSIMIGNLSGNLSMTGENNIGIGEASLINILTGQTNIGIGKNTLINTTSGSNNIAIGYNAQYSYTGSNSIAIGYLALEQNISGTGNLAIGERALKLTTSEGNLGVGHTSLFSNTTGEGNTAVGGSSLGSNTTGSYNVGLGRHAGYSGVTGQGNVFIGFQAGYGAASTSPSNNVAIGAHAGNSVTGDGNIFIGRNAGFTEVGSNKLYIENSTSSAPLIYGELDNDLIKINGKLGYSANGGNPTTIAGRDGTYFSDITVGEGLTLNSGVLATESISIISPSQITSDQDNYNPTGWSTARFVRISGDNGFRAITSFVAAPDGSEKTLINSGSFPLYLTSEHPDGIAANRIILDKDYILFPKQSVDMFYDGTDTRWRILNENDRENKRSLYYSWSAGSIQSTANEHMSISAISGGTSTQIASTTSLPAAAELSTSTTTNGGVTLYLSKTVNTFSSFGSAHIMMDGLISIPSLSDGTNSFVVSAQLVNSPTSTSSFPNNTIGIRYTHNVNSGKWEGFSRDNSGSESSVDLGISVTANTLYLLRVEIDKSNTEARFYIDNNYVGRMTSNLPTSVVCGSRLIILKSAGATARTLRVHQITSSAIYP